MDTCPSGPLSLRGTPVQRPAFISDPKPADRIHDNQLPLDQQVDVRGRSGADVQVGLLSSDHLVQGRAVALSDGRLLVTLTDVDWPGRDPASAP